MESHSCEKKRGEGVLPTAAFPAVPTSDLEDDSLRCRHVDALGRRCRMFVSTPQPAASDLPDALQEEVAELCPHHAHLFFRRHRVREANAAELLASVSDFNDPASVNRFLGNLLKLVAVKRVPRRDGMALAYISQLILNSQAAQDRRELVRLEIAELEEQREEKNTPTRVIWDLPMRKSAEIRKAVEEESQRDDRKKGQEASAGKGVPSQPPAAPAASTQSDNHAAAQVPPQASAATQPLSAASPSAPTTPASPSSSAPPAPSDRPQPVTGFSVRREGHTVDWYAPASWNKPVRRRYPFSRWY